MRSEVWGGHGGRRRMDCKIWDAVVSGGGEWDRSWIGAEGEEEVGGAYRCRGRLEQEPGNGDVKDQKGSEA